VVVEWVVVEMWFGRKERFKINEGYIWVHLWSELGAPYT
jgi:hypothetical protein